jgi:hypothetical protein
MFIWQHYLMHPVLILLCLSRRACEGIVTSTKIGPIIAVLDGMAYPEFRLSIFKCLYDLFYAIDITSDIYCNI